jgi:CRP-like cAMP-binding protein
MSLRQFRHDLVPNPRNHLLVSLPADDLARIWPRLECVELPLRYILFRPEQRITHVHFMESGWASMITVLIDGGAAEVGHAGREGMAGLPLVHGIDTGSVEAMVQTPAVALRMSGDALREEMARSPAFQALLLRYTLAFSEQVTQTAACNGRHLLEQRLARWLLMAHDRAEGDEFTMTQDFLAMMLCVTRPSVTMAALHLQEEGLISYGRGRIKVSDRNGLEAITCECYGVVRRRYEQLVGCVG